MYKLKKRRPISDDSLRRVTTLFMKDLISLPPMSRILDFYLKGQYFKNNPTWDASDTNWKFTKLHDELQATLPKSGGAICEVGCGSGELLKKFAQCWPEHKFMGWDIAPDAKNFWNHKQENLNFQVGNYITDSPKIGADTILLIDVLEHLADPATFLEDLQEKCQMLVIHLPLDMTVINVLFDGRLIQLRNTIGHIHYYTKALAEKLLEESGYEVVVSKYSNAWKDSPNLRLSGKIFRFIRSIVHFFSPSWNAKLLGGESLVLVAKRKSLTKKGELP